MFEIAGFIVAFSLANILVILFSPDPYPLLLYPVVLTAGSAIAWGMYFLWEKFLWPYPGCDGKAFIWFLIAFGVTCIDFALSIPAIAIANSYDYKEFTAAYIAITLATGSILLRIYFRPEIEEVFRHMRRKWQERKRH